MTIFVQSVTATEITAFARAESDSGEIIGDARITLQPGQSWGSVTFEALRDNGVGAYEIPSEDPA